MQNPEALHNFIVRAKRNTYVGDGQKTTSSRTAAHDLKYSEEPMSYLDSYFGGTNFIGQETVWHANQAIWAMNYHGYILRPELITPSQAGQVIKASLSLLYAQNRFLGGFTNTHEHFLYTDTNEGNVGRFVGREWIERNGEKVYELVYHGGLVID